MNRNDISIYMVTIELKIDRFHAQLMHTKNISQDLLGSYIVWYIKKKILVSNRGFTNDEIGLLTLKIRTPTPLPGKRMICSSDICSSKLQIKLVNQGKVAVFISFVSLALMKLIYVILQNICNCTTVGNICQTAQWITIVLKLSGFRQQSFISIQY